MNTDWQQFLTQQGATIASGVALNFGDAAAELRAAAKSTVICDLSQFGTLRVSGDDAQSFLQNMFSNDTREVSANRAQLSSLNNPKGRMFATMLIWKNGDDFMLQLPSALCEPIRKKLGMYVMRAKVKILDASDEIVSLGIAGENAQETLMGQFGELPQQPMDFADFGQVGMLKLSDSRFLLSTRVQNAAKLWQQLSKHAQPAGSACWDWLNIRAAIPVILPQTQEQFVPQMANLEVLGGVNFKKGCYPGQEIVARMQYLGKSKRRMYLFHMDGESLPGDELYSAEIADQAAGMIANVSAAPDGGFDLLAVVQISSRDSLHYKSLQGEKLQLLTQPYPLPQD